MGFLLKDWSYKTWFSSLTESVCVDAWGKAYSHDSVRQLFDLNNSHTGGHRFFSFPDEYKS